MGLTNASAFNRAIILAALAIFSAILSNFAWHGGILWAPRLVIWDVPLLPGLFFGTVLALAIWLWVSRRIFAIAVILLSTVLAWLAAGITAEYALEYALTSIQKMLHEIAGPGKAIPPINLNFLLAVCGVLGGLVGSTTLTFGLSLVCKEFGAFENWARIVMPGTALGVLLELLAKDDKFPVHIGSILPLFLAWQATVAAVIGYCIVPRTGDCKPVPQ
jgi:hypothetical protein